MPFTSIQQEKLNAAQKRNDDAKKNWQSAVEFWNTHFVNIRCDKQEKHDAIQAATWFTPNDRKCYKGSDGCRDADKELCQSEMKLILSNIGTIRNSYAEFNAAQANYDRVFNEVTAEAAADPVIVLEQAEIEANAEANKYKQIFWIILLLIAAVATFIYFKWFRK